MKNLKILDPACGSGSFLIGAYQFLLDWHLGQYVNDNPEKQAKRKKPVLYQRDKGEWRLTSTERKRILSNSIYGVDIDPQAVEVTKLSLLLKTLEGEDGESIGKQMSIFQDRVLPDLANNIKCGNSLIGTDFYDNQQMALNEEEIYRINVFDWNAEFSEIMKNGGFDAVIGNPPYIGFQGFSENKSYLSSHYLSATGKFDVYVPFIEKGIKLLREKGMLSYICPTNFIKRGYGKNLKQFLKENVKIKTIIDFQDIQIFKGVLNYTGIYIFENEKADKDSEIRYSTRSLESNGFYFLQQHLSNDSWIFRDKRSEDFIEKIQSQRVKNLKEISTGISEGIVTGNNSVFLLERAKAEEYKLEKEIIIPCARGNQLRRYYIDNITDYIIYPYKTVNGKTFVITDDEMKYRFPNTWDYLQSQKSNLSGRGYFERSAKVWYELWCQRNMKELNRRKILVPELAESNRFCLAEGNIYYGDTVCGITLKETAKEDLLYILGMLNSHLIEYYYKQTTVPKANQFYIYKTMFLNKIPIRIIDFFNPNDKADHDQMVNLVNQMLELNKNFAEANLPQKKTVLARQIEATDRQIDQLVYQLYDLTEEEIKIVEGEKI